MGAEAAGTRRAGIVALAQCWCCRELGPSFAGAEPGCAGCWKGKSSCRRGMQRCTPDLEELGQPLDQDTHSGEDPGGSSMEGPAQLQGKGSLNHVQ